MARIICLIRGRIKIWIYASCKFIIVLFIATGVLIVLIGHTIGVTLHLDRSPQ